MANISVSSNIRGVIFDMGKYSSVLGLSHYFRDKGTVLTVSLMPDRIEYKTSDQVVFKITWFEDAANPTYFTVDSVNGNKPTSLKHLFDLLVELLN